MNKNIKPVLIGISVFAISSLLLTSCYTVKGAFQGAGKDVAVLVGPEGNHHHHKANTKHVAKAQSSTVTKQVKTTKPVNQTTTTPQSSTAPQSTTTPQPANTQTKTTY